MGVARSAGRVLNMQFVDKLRSIQDTIAHAVRFAKHLDDCPTGSEHEHEHEQEQERARKCETLGLGKNPVDDIAVDIR